MDKVECSQCGQNCVPRLWNYKPALSDFWIINLRYLKSQHLCPFCGVCMYESGGELTLMGKLFIFYVLIPLPIMVAIDDHDFPVWSYIVYCLLVTPLVWFKKTREIIRRYKKS